MSDNPVQDTLVILKPDALARRLTGRLISRLEDKEIDIVAMKLIRMTEPQAEQLYTQHIGKYFCARLIRFTTSGPVFVLVCRGRHAIRRIRRLIGETDPESALPGTIRGDFSCHQTYNLIHASDTVESAAREIGIFFRKEEIHNALTAQFPWHSFPENREQSS